jgi:hypothetical protein
MIQQHNTWGKDRDDLASLASKVITESYEDGEDKDAEYFAAHDELPESQDDLDRHEASKSEDAENSTPREIGDIENYYGGLSVKTEGGKHFWSIENYDGDSWKEIPADLFAALNAFEDSRENSSHEASKSKEEGRGN